MPIRRLGRACAVSALLFCPAPGASADPPREVRALWIMRWSLSTPQSIRQIVAQARKNRFNTLFVQVRGRGDAWNRSELEPRAEALADAPADYDPLALVVEEAHRAGMKVHAWMNTFLVWTGPRPPKSPRHVLNSRPDWIARDHRNRFSTANTQQCEGAFLQPSHPEVQEHLHRVFTDVARRYDVDGIHFDYVRYPNADYDMSDGALARFRAWLEPRLTASQRAAITRDGSRVAAVRVCRAQWEQWRRDQITGLVRRIADTVHREKPWVQVSAAVFANAEDAVTQRGQEWRRWLAEGIVDAVCPMAYSRDTGTVERQIRDAVAVAGDRHVYAGIGAWRLAPEDTVRKIDRARRAGARGVALFSYDNVTRNGRQSAYLDRVSRGAFPSRAAPPDMRWRSRRPEDREP